MASRLLLPVLVQNGDLPMTVTVLLVAADRPSERASVSTSIAVLPGNPDWQAWLADTVASRAREGAERLGVELSPARLLDHRFVPLDAVVPVATLPR